MEETCFNHHNKHSKGKCAFCTKPYCDDCLLLTGELKTVICKSCYGVYSSQFKQSITRRKIYVFGGIITLTPIIYYAIVTIETGLGTTFTILSIALIASVIINIIRIKHMRKFLISANYK